MASYVGAALIAAFFGGRALGQSETVAENMAKILAESTTETITNIAQNANTNINATASVEVGAGCKFTNNVINQRNVISLEKNMFQSIVVSNEVKQEVGVVMQQMAEALSESFGGEGGKIEAKNISNLTTRLYTKITNTILQDCSSRISTDQSVSCEGEGAVFSNNYINQETIVNVLKNCIQSAAIDSAIDQTIDFDLTQKASAIQKNMLAWTILISCVVLVIAVAIFFRDVLKRFTDWRFIAAITPLIFFVGYLIVAKNINAWPFAISEMLTTNPNIVAESYSQSTPISPAEHCKNLGYHSVQYVEKRVLNSVTRELETRKTFDINTPETQFTVYCRVRPSAITDCTSGSENYQCPDGSCCVSAAGCDEEGKCST